MSERNKRIASAVLIIGGLLLIGYNYMRSAGPKVHGRHVEQPVHLDSLFALEASEPVLEQEADILALFVLKSDVCPPCVNNTFEDIDLLKKQDKNITATALFMEAEPKKVHRFVDVTGLPVPYRIATKERTPDPLKNAVQQLVFIDPAEEKIFYRLTIPGNVTSPPEYKKKMLTQAFKRWDNL